MEKHTMDVTSPEKIRKSVFLHDSFVILNKVLLRKGAHLYELRNTAKHSNIRNKNGFSKCSYTSVILIIAVLIYYSVPYFDGMVKTALTTKCVVPNNYIVWEATRPVADCSICKNITSIPVLENPTRSDFMPYAYTYKPILVKGAALDWPALHDFDYYFFKRLFDKIPDAHASVEEDCQFLNFKSDFTNLEEVFSMSEDRVFNRKGSIPWYIGWSNCHPDVLKEMRKHYTKPHFLPVDAEHSHIDFIFMGYQQGAFMHLDYISRLMWQAQLKGHKVWRLNPPPECESSCSSITFTVSPGDILLLDTRQWYHDTYVVDGEFSITVSSEYG